VSTTARAAGNGRSDAGREGEGRKRASIRSAITTWLAPPGRTALDRASFALFLLMLTAIALAAPATYRRLRPYLELTYGSAAMAAAPPASTPARAPVRPAPSTPKRHAPWRSDEIVAGLLIAAETAHAQGRPLTSRLLKELRERDPRVPSWSVVYRAAQRTGSTGAEWLRDAERDSRERAARVSARPERAPERLWIRDMSGQPRP
jgi:hypothetical protein